MIDLASYLADKAPRSVATCLITTREDVDSHPIHLRFELHPPRSVITAETEQVLPGDDFHTAFLKSTAPIVKHAVQRVTRIFESIFLPDDDLIILVKADPSRKSDGYLDSLIRPAQNARRLTQPIDGGVQHAIEVRLDDIDYRKVLAGIAHVELGRQPCVPQLVYFVNLTRDIVFRMYDDRGCLAFSDDTEKLMFLYHEFKAWIIGGFMG